MSDLLKVALHSLGAVPVTGAVPPRRPFAVLAVGKASRTMLSAPWVRGAELGLGILPKGKSFGALPLLPRLQILEAEHPFPGAGSSHAALALLEFFLQLSNRSTPHLEVLLSGGASSLLWLPRHRLAEGELRRLWNGGFSIQELNRRRGRLCQLKAGGAARWATWLAPHLSIRVQVLSDVEPYGLEVVGGGPFWDAKMPHLKVGSNSTWIDLMAQGLGDAPLWAVESGQSIGGAALIRKLGKWIRQARGPGWILWGGEARWKIPKHAGAGGRLSHLTAQLLHEHLDLLGQRKVQFAFVASDGVDGLSGGSAYVGNPSLYRNLDRYELARSLHRFSTGEYMARRGMRLPECYTGMNLQDALILRIPSR